ncbi:hypothetical protein [Ruegeria marina]|uniref:Thymidylate synthase n=1 Tax=Ruegeria marina TaxID=639004 RepID=A0A1G6SCR2_9RHOB|nr:hypothetical protein [Ruegeria marina]SDD13996.1 hypothetical protein SAMN04488239_105227 [Ruegeria marina]
MKPYLVAMATCVALSACGGSNAVFGTGDGTDGGGGTPANPVVPADIAGNITSISYDPDNQTLVVRGAGLDDVAFTDVYTRKPALDRPGYEAYTAQDGSLTRHFTAYVREIDGTYGAVIGSGGQFNTVIQGTQFGRDGAYDPPATTPNGGVVSYAGNYIGVLNRNGSGEDLLPVTPGTDPSVIPGQVAEVTGNVLINAGFGDTQNQVDGIIYNRQIADTGLSMEDLSLRPTEITSNGTFTGEVMTPDLRNVGGYAGLFGGQDASVVAGALHVEDHVGALENEVEYGTFVLGVCGGPNADPLCDQPNP